MTEILQPSIPSYFNSYSKSQSDKIGLDISCNLASTVIKNAMAHAKLTGSLEGVVSTAINLLDSVARQTSIDEVPAVKKANDLMRSVGLGAMGLHSYLALNEIYYGSPEAIEFVDIFFAAQHFYARKRSMEIARDTGFVFDGFNGSKYKSGEYFTQYLEQDFVPKSEKVAELFEGITLPTRTEWAQLVQYISIYGLAHSFVSAIAPTG